MERTFTARNVEELPKIARQLLELYGQKRIFALYGELGAGKTTLIQSLCRELGVKEKVNSPSFAIAHEYTAQQLPPTSSDEAPMNNTIYHLDFYRIEGEEEALNAGLDHYLQHGRYCFIEWASKVEALLPRNRVNLTLEFGVKEERTIRTQTPYE